MTDAKLWALRAVVVVLALVTAANKPNIWQAAGIATAWYLLYWAVRQHFFAKSNTAQTDEQGA